MLEAELLRKDAEDQVAGLVAAAKEAIDTAKSRDGLQGLDVTVDSFTPGR